jgi:hypothetical protein
VEVTTSPYVAMYRVRYDDASSRKVYFNFQNYTTRHFPKELPVRNHNEVEFPDDNTITGNVSTTNKTLLANYLRNYFVSSLMNTISSYPYPGSTCKGEFLTMGGEHLTISENAA